MNKTYVVIWKDSLGCPRAWGAADNLERAEAEASAQLREYIIGRPDTRADHWTSETKIIEENTATH